MKLEKHSEADDPYALVGHGVPVEDGVDAAGDMALCFVEEYAMMGFPRSMVAGIFRNPYYQGPHGVFCLRGEEFVTRILDEVYGPEGTNATSL
jgi:hypothetical protein